MNKVKIITDSTADLTEEMYKNNDIVVLPLSVNIGEDVYLDGVTITPDELYKKIEEKGILASSAAIPPQVIEDEFKKWIDEGYDILFTGIGSTISTTYRNAEMAKANLPEDRIFLIDSKNLSSATGLLVLKMAKLRDEGKSAKEIYDVVKELPNKLSAQFVVDKLDYLHKGGRCSSTAKIFGHLLHIHPMIKVVDGKLIVFKKARGKMEVGIDEQIEVFKEDIEKNGIDLDNVMITHSGIDQSLLDYFVKRASEFVDKDIIRITRAGCVISTHCGPGTIGILYINK